MHFLPYTYAQEKWDKAFSKGDLGYIFAYKVWG